MEISHFYLENLEKGILKFIFCDNLNLDNFYKTVFNIRKVHFVFDLCESFFFGTNKIFSNFSEIKRRGIWFHFLK